MASELRVNTLKDAAGANSVAMEYVAGGSAKAWANINGDAATIRDSLNASSMTDDGTGLYYFTYTNAMGNSNYCGLSTTNVDGSQIICNLGEVSATYEQTTARTARNVSTRRDNGSANDTLWTNIMSMGDLA
jgi:hypothetical protein